MKKFSIIVAGPTAVGKTAVAISLAKWLGTEIISADSRQCYQEISIGVARPDEQELAAVPHHFIASHSILTPVNAASYAAYALNKMEDIFKSEQTVVVVGGTGLYLKSLEQGLDQIPPISDEIHQKVNRDFQLYGLEWLQKMVQENDPEFFASGEIQNPRRLMRALEVWMETGKSIKHFQTGNQQTRSFENIKIALELSREELYDRINHRVDLMVAAGLVEEVQQLQAWLLERNLSPTEIPALHTVGYTELFDVLNGKWSVQEAIEKIKQHTRNYAKRQMTWFKKDPEVQWFHPENLEGMKTLIQERVHNNIT